jgi:hypothetical protein
MEDRYDLILLWRWERLRSGGHKRERYPDTYIA